MGVRLDDGLLGSESEVTVNSRPKNWSGKVIGVLSPPRHEFHRPREAGLIYFIWDSFRILRAMCIMV